MYELYFRPSYNNDCNLYFIECIDHYSSVFMDKKLYEIIKDKNWWD